MARILVVDDDPHFLDSLALLLQTSGHQTLTAANGDAALKALATEAPDAIVTDLYMPEKDGVELIIEVRRRFPGLPIIATSGQFHPSFDLLQMARTLGANRIVPKPFRRADICQAIESALSA